LYTVGARVELYNLAQDIGERKNLAAREPQRVASMREELHQWVRGVPAELPGVNTHFDPARALLETRTKADHVR